MLSLQVWTDSPWQIELLTYFSCVGGTRDALNVLPGPLPSITWWFIKNSFDTPEKGAYSSLFAATSPDVKTQPDRFKGAFLLPVDQVTVPKIDTVRLDDMGRNLWDLSQQLVAKGTK